MTSTAARRTVLHGNRSRGAASAQAVPEIRSLTGLRIVAAMWVVCFHLSWAPGGAYVRTWEPLLPLIRHGMLGVDLFFVLSGFVITLTYLDKLGPRPSARGAVTFWWARICRIWPVHAVVTGLFGIWMAFKAFHGDPGVYQPVQPVADLPHWIEQMLMVQMWHRPFIEGSSWVGPAWSISAEWAAYVAFPVLALVLWRLRTAPPLVTGVLAVGCMLPVGVLSTLEGALTFPYAWALRIACGFAAGAFMCLTVRGISRTERVDRIATRVAVLATVEMLIMLWADSSKQGSDNSGALAVIAFPVLIGALALSTRGPSRWLSTDAMVFGGKISFAMYLVHIPLFEIAYTLMKWYPRLDQGTGPGTFILPHLLAATWLVGYLVHRFVEEPARRSMRRVRLPLGRPDGGKARHVPEAPSDVTGHVADLVPAARAGQVAARVGS
jgi:peptidoglycan/LPS O-acetylase OafA/YrhL